MALSIITLSINIPVTDAVNLRLLLSIPVIVVKDLKDETQTVQSLRAEKS